jgi:hypothetical protein
MTIVEEITEIFNQVFGIEPSWFTFTQTIDLIQERMELAEVANDQKVLKYQDHFNEVTFYLGLVTA